MKSHTRLLVSLLTISIIASTTGCSKQNIKNRNVNNNLEYEISIDESTKKELGQDDVVLIENIPGAKIEFVNSNLENILRDSLYDENIDYNFILSVYQSLDSDKRIEFKNEYLKAIYMLMVNSNISIAEYLKELQTMTLMQQVPMCVPEDIWNSSFKNLIALAPNCESLFDLFSEFAIYVHDLECEENHTLNEYGQFTCPSLENEYSHSLQKAII